MIKPGLFRIILLAALFFLPGSACQNTSDLQGSYWAESSGETKPDYINLVLNPNGQGFWTRGDERASFKWETNNNKIWLHTKSGGIVRGTIIKNDRIEIMLPGTGILLFKKVLK